jgi:nucleoside-diphosphate-sugar epimerase
MELNGTKILVTGATGFIGSRLVEVLVQKHNVNVRAMLRNLAAAPRIARFPIEMVRCDISDESAVKQAAVGCDIIIHAAYGSSGTPQEQRDATVRGTECVLKAGLAASVRRIVHVSTVSVYGIVRDGTLTEETARGPLTDGYSRYKAEAEDVALEYYRKHNAPVAVIQPTVVYGPFSPPWTSGPLTWLRTSRVVLANGGTGLCNAVYVDDVVQAILLAAQRPQAVGQCVLISGSSPVTWAEFLGAYEAMLGYSSTIALTEGERNSMARRERWRSFKRAVARLITTPEFHDCLRASILLRLLHAGMKRLVPKKTAETIRRVGRSAPVPVDLRPSERPIQFPDRQRFRWLAAKTAVSIEKATRLLGYQPQFDLAKGMQLTRLWAQWANLLSNC